MKNYFRCRSSSTRVLLALMLFTAGECLVVKAALFRPEATNTGPQKTLTFSDRVAYQYAIEEVYWRHRIWPKSNPGPKPSLDEVMSRAQIEKKVEDYLRNSQALEDYWQPITPEQLQAEMERMAHHTKQPEVLRELFAALNNDPCVLAECLARPILAERLIASSAVVAGVSPALTNSFAAQTAATTVKDSAGYTLPEISLPLDCTDDTWTATSITNAASERYNQTAVWTGSEMIVWGGYSSGVELNTGGRYDPSTDSWSATSLINAPVRRTDHTGVWTGNEMIVWGGYFQNGGSFTWLNTGGRYNPSTDSWTPTSTTNSPSARSSHTAVWAASEMIVWGGLSMAGNNIFNTGGRYNPRTDAWTSTSTAGVPSARASHTAVWTGSEMIVWGGGNHSNTGGRYNPSTDSWTVTSTTNAPTGREYHTAIWTGSEMMVWGGEDPNFVLLNAGARYTPSVDTWTPISSINPPQARKYHTAVWTGNEMTVWGGEDQNLIPLNTGGRYNRNADSWTPTTSAGAPPGVFKQTAVWTGSEMIIWGGEGAAGFLNTGGRYCAQPSAPIVQNAGSRKTHGSVGNFDVALPLTGTPGIECRSGGVTNDYTIVVTFLANVSVIGSPQAAVTAGSGTVGSGGISNGGMVTISGNVVTIPLTNVSNAQTINVTLNSVNGSTNVVIPMSILIGDTTGNGSVNAGDVSQTKSRIGQATDQTNFRSDVNTNGSINAADVSIVKSSLGTGLP